MNSDLDRLFEPRVTFPDPDAQTRLADLVGLEVHQNRLSKILGLLVNPTSIKTWQQTFHPDAISVLKMVLRSSPLVVLAGDVGCGKTHLAETIGDTVAREQDVDLTLFPLSLSTRGQGRVGEMTQLLSAAFQHIVEEAMKFGSASGPHRGALILLVDEADALTQTRETSQMHHEDRAGVNAFIRGVDRLASAHIPAAVIMCTNRLDALDPAVRRRAAEILTFFRPDSVQRCGVLEPSLRQMGFNRVQIAEMVDATGSDTQGHCFTFSDLTQRLIPAIVLDAYPEGPVDPRRALKIARDMQATPPFQVA